MGVTLDYLVDINILSDAPLVPAADFSTILLLAEGATYTGKLTQIYYSAAEVAADSDLDAATIAYASLLFSQRIHPGKIKIGEVTPGAPADYDAALVAIFAEDPDFYCVCTVLKTDAALLEISTWVAANGEKICVLQSLDADILTDTTPNALSAITDLSHGRTLFMYKSVDTHVFDLSWAAFMLSADPDVGSASWPFSPIVGVAIDALTATERDNCLDNFCSVLLNFGGSPGPFGGKACDGGYIDKVISGDWLRARTQEAIIQLLKDSAALHRKITFSDLGLSQIGSVIWSKLAIGEDKDHLAVGSSYVDIPLVSSLASATIASRSITIAAGANWANSIDQGVTVNFRITDA